MSFFGRIGDFLSSAVGNNLDNNPEDVKRTKRNLRTAGYFKDDKEDNVDNPYITRKTDTSIKQYQRDNGLKEDGLLFPGGETERSLARGIMPGEWDLSRKKTTRKEKQPEHVGFGGIITGTLDALTSKNAERDEPYQLSYERKEEKTEPYKLSFEREEKKEEEKSDNRIQSNTSFNAKNIANALNDFIERRDTQKTEDDTLKRIQVAQAGTVKSDADTLSAGSFGEPAKNVDATGRIIKEEKKSPHQETLPPLPRRKPEIISPTAKGNEILDLIGKVESSDNYNIIYGQEEKPLTTMTIKDIYKLQDQMVADGRSSSAVGRYQFLKGTLQEEVKKLGIPENALFDEKLQDKLARSRLAYRGFEKFKAGEIDANTLINNLAHEWAALPKDASNKSRHDGVLDNKARTDFKSLKEILDKD